MTKRNRLKKEAHDIANEVWEYAHMPSRNKMYAWIEEKKHLLGGHSHIRDMTILELRTLIRMFAKERSLRAYQKQTVKIPKKKIEVIKL